MIQHLTWILRTVLAAPAVLLLGLSAPAPANAGDCRYIGEQCIEGPETRNINGTLVTRDCWKYEAAYECIKPDSVDYCAALRQTPSCYQTSTACVQTAFDGTCMKETKTFRCDDPNQPAPSNTTVLDDTYTVDDKGPDATQCEALSSNENCQIASRSCVEGPETRIVNGLPVYKECWRWEEDYTCVNPVRQNTCERLETNQACTKVGEVCVETDPRLGCTLKDIQYSCVTRPGTTEVVRDCSARSTCVGDTCWETGSPPDTDFANAVIAQEIARQGSLYQDASGFLFTGVAEQCREGWGGLRSCCDRSPGSKTNNGILMKAGFSAVSAVGKQAANVGSKYMFDFMYSGTEWASFVTEKGAEMAVNATTGATSAFSPTNFTPSIELYGFGWTSGAAPSGASVLGNGFYFDPYSFAFAMAVMVIQELMSCEPEEQQLGMHREANLTHYVGSYCSQRVMGICVERKQSYCSYNSVLAKIINVQGRPQLGKTFGTPRNPDCSGFTIDDFARVDFSQMDLSEFIDDVMQAAEVPDPTTISNTVADKLKGKTVNDPNEATPKLPFGAGG